MMIDVKRAAQLLREQDDILILTHMNPDGDTLGCGFGLCRALLKFGKRARVINSDEIQKKYEYLFANLEMPDFEEKYIVSVDIATQSLFGEKLACYSDKVDLSIDHHPTNSFFAKETLLDDTAGATCEIIYEIIEELAIPFDKDMANCIYTGLSTDTGCFKYDNATSRTYICAAKMIDCGADNGKINQVMFDTKTRTFAKLERLSIDTLRLYFDERCAVMEVTQKMYRKSGSDETEVEGLVDLPRRIEGVLVGVTIKEKPDGTCKASVRSRAGFSASELCQRMGGGGHPQAAACSFDVGVAEAKQRILDEIEKMLK